jgi:hypothetical protein
MNRSIKLGVLAVIALLVLALAAVPSSGQPSQAQEKPLPAAPAAGTGTAPADAAPPNTQGTAVEGSVPRGAAAVHEAEPDLVSAWLRIPGTTLKPRASDVEWAAGGDGGGIYATSGNQYEWFNAAVYLPQGSTVTMLRVYVGDTNAGKTCQGYFTVYGLYGGIHQEWGGNSAGISGDGWFDVSIPNEVIDYSSYSYVVNWQAAELGSDMVLYGFRLYYTPPGGKAYMPSVLRDGP